MTEKERNQTIIEISNLLSDAGNNAEQIDFCTGNIMEYTQPCAYEQYEEEERPLHFWYDKDTICKYAEIQRALYFDLIVPKLEKAQELLETILQEGADA